LVTGYPCITLPGNATKGAFRAGGVGRNRKSGESQLLRAGVQRDAIPLWPGCRGGSALLGSRGNAHWQVKGGSHYRVKDEVPWRVEGSRPIGSRVKRLAQGELMPCVNSYWVLPDAKFAGFAASPPFPRPRSIFAGRRESV